jgi:hypothetical protein
VSHWLMEGRLPPVFLKNGEGRTSKGASPALKQVAHGPLLPCPLATMMAGSPSVSAHSLSY